MLEDMTGRVSGRAWSRILTQDAAQGSTTIAHARPNGTMVVQRRQRVDHITDRNKAIYASVDARAPFSSGMGSRVASLPVSVWWDLKERGILDDQKRFRRWMNDSENVHFRTRPGRV